MILKAALVIGGIGLNRTDQCLAPYQQKCPGQIDIPEFATFMTGNLIRRKRWETI